MSESRTTSNFILDTVIIDKNTIKQTGPTMKYSPAVQSQPRCSLVPLTAPLIAQESAARICREFSISCGTCDTECRHREPDAAIETCDGTCCRDDVGCASPCRSCVPHWNIGRRWCSLHRRMACGSMQRAVMAGAKKMRWQEVAMARHAFVGVTFPRYSVIQCQDSHEPLRPSIAD
jgi:hypothetical protein